MDGRNLGLREFNAVRPIIDDDEAIAAEVDPLEEGALKVTGRPDQNYKGAATKGCGKFCAFVNKYNWKEHPTSVPAGFNIIITICILSIDSAKVWTLGR